MIYANYANLNMTSSFVKKKNNKNKNKDKTKINAGQQFTWNNGNN